MDPWFDEAIDDILSTRRSGALSGFSKTSLVFDDEFSRIHDDGRKSRSRVKTKVSDTNLERSVVSLDFEEMKKKVSNFQQEIYKLQAANSDLTQVNKRWHRYNTDMQIFIDKLQTTIRDQQEQINNIGESNLFTKKDDKACTRNECRRMREEIVKLKEDNSHLIHQIKAHKDDWEAEKNEKQQIIKERDCLQQRLNEVLSQRATSEIGKRSCGCCQSSWTKGLDHIHGMPILRDSNIVCDGCFNAGDSSGEEELRGYDRSTEDGACCSRSATESYLSLPPFETSPTSSTNSVHSDQQTFAMGIKSLGATVTSYVQMPVVKSSSAPERRSTSQKPTKFVNSISLSVLGPNPASQQQQQSTIISKSRSMPSNHHRRDVACDSSSVYQTPPSSSTTTGEKAGGQQSFSSSPQLPAPQTSSSTPAASSFDADVITCPNCLLAFAPKSYVEYVDHCESCHKPSFS